LKRRACFLICVILLTAMIPVVAADSVVLFMWTDAEGKVHFTSNYNSIPKPFRKTSLKGMFLPDKDTANNTSKPKCKNSDPESQETNYYVKDGNIYVVGSVANGYSQSISYVKVKISFFDAKDQFIKAESTYVEPLELGQCQKGKFSVVTTHESAITNFKTEFIWK